MRIGSSHEAEIYAILNALFIAERLTVSTAYHVVTDCEGAITSLTGGGSPKTRLRNWPEQLRKIIGDKPVTFAHVKAHTGRTDPRSYINNIVDKIAKAGAVAQRRTMGVMTRAQYTAAFPEEVAPKPKKKTPEEKTASNRAKRQRRAARKRKEKIAMQKRATKKQPQQGAALMRLNIARDAAVKELS